MDSTDMNTTPAPSKFRGFIGHPVTVELLRVAVKVLLTVGGDWVYGKSIRAYREKKNRKMAERMGVPAPPPVHPNN